MIDKVNVYNMLNPNLTIS